MFLLMIQPLFKCFGKSLFKAAFKASYLPFKKKKKQQLYFHNSIVTLHFTTKNGIVLTKARACIVQLVSNDLTVYTVGIPLRSSNHYRNM